VIKIEYTAYFDGAAINNPGPAGIGYVILNDNNEIIWKHSEAIGIATNNEAEYQALIVLAKKLVDKKIDNVVIYGDSQLVVNQVNGKWRINHQHLFKLHREVCNILSEINNWQLHWVPRDKNSLADNLSKKALALDETNECPSFTGKIEQIRETIFLAYDSKIYAVDAGNQACTCPGFIKKFQRPCKHLLAVSRMQEYF
jgi:ribonuclease HI